MLTDLFIISDMDSIKAAQIQGLFSLLGAIVGAIVIIVSIFLTAKFTLKAHKADKLAELKAKVYLECVESYSDFVAQSIQFFNEDAVTFRNNLWSQQKKFTLALNKTSFVSSGKTQLDVANFMLCFKKWFMEFNGLLDMYYKTDQERLEFLNVNNLVSKINPNDFKYELTILLRNKINELDNIFRDVENKFKKELGVGVSKKINNLIGEETKKRDAETREYVEEEILKKINKNN